MQQPKWAGSARGVRSSAGPPRSPALSLACSRARCGGAERRGAAGGGCSVARVRQALPHHHHHHHHDPHQHHPRHRCRRRRQRQRVIAACEALRLGAAPCVSLVVLFPRRRTRPRLARCASPAPSPPTFPCGAGPKVGRGLAAESCLLARGPGSAGGRRCSLQQKRGSCSTRHHHHHAENAPQGVRRRPHALGRQPPAPHAHKVHVPVLVPATANAA
eukprot:scaffold1165_cov323-Prasinococcus_capsulatus_cf.AAC.5